MKLYVVCGGFSYEGESATSIRVFSSEEKAEKYQEKLLSEERGFDYVRLEVRDLDVEESEDY